MGAALSLDLRKLETFRVVARVGRISAAAREVHLSQPAVTAQVQQLEESLGQALLVRTARGVVLTAAGRTLLEYANRLEALSEEAVEAVSGTPEKGGELRLAASTTIAGYVMPILVADFRRREPAVHVRLEVGNTAEVLDAVGRGRVPLGLVEGLARAPRLRLERYLDDELLPVISRDAPSGLARVRRAAELAHVPVLMREPGSGTRAVVERALRKAGARRQLQAGDLELGSTQAIKTAALLGLGVAFLSRWSIREELATGRLRLLPIADLSIQRVFSWALPAAELGGVAGRFLAHARRTPPSGP